MEIFKNAIKSIYAKCINTKSYAKDMLNNVFGGDVINVIKNEEPIIAYVIVLAILLSALVAGVVILSLIMLLIECPIIFGILCSILFIPAIIVFLVKRRIS